VIDDLAVFGLTPPSSLADVRAARNKEIKKYHSDKFVNEPDRFETSKEIMQIYNAAFDRLRAYYEKV
jgi:curved DNA-binding protein CbpA